MNAQGNRCSHRGALFQMACTALIMLAGCALLGAPAPAAADDTINLAGTWKFKPDWQEEKQVKGWQRPDFDDSQWQTLRVPATWEEQGIVAGNRRWPPAEAYDGYNGYAWYRRHFTVPPDWADAKATLRIGQIDDFGWIYINGRLVGSRIREIVPDRELKYLHFPASGSLEAGRDNVIALRICDLARWGGIVRGPVALVKAPPAGPPPGAYGQTRGDMASVMRGLHVPADTVVDGNVVSVGESASIEGRVTGDVVAVGGDVRARPGSRIDGDVAALGGKVIREGDAQITGRVVNLPELAPVLPGWAMKRLWRLHYLGSPFAIEPIRDKPSRWPVLNLPRACFGGFWGGLVLLCGPLALLVVLAFPRRLQVMAEALVARPGRAALWGLGGFVLLPTAAGIAAAVFFAGKALVPGLYALDPGRAVLLLFAYAERGAPFPLAPGVLGVLIRLAEMVPHLAVAALMLLGTAGVWLSIGEAVATRLGRPQIHAAWALLIGLLLVALLAALPVVGLLVVVALLLFGFGAASMTGLGADPEWWAHPRLRASRTGDLAP